MQGSFSSLQPEIFAGDPEDWTWSLLLMGPPWESGPMSEPPPWLPTIFFLRQVQMWRHQIVLTRSTTIRQDSFTWWFSWLFGDLMCLIWTQPTPTDNMDSSMRGNVPDSCTDFTSTWMRCDWPCTPRECEELRWKGGNGTGETSAGNNFINSTVLHHNQQCTGAVYMQQAHTTMHPTLEESKN